ncbi:helix-turn-helix domain-containing protein [Jutongia hominis]|uniref:Helix-turn-helix transcriptional regulator n=1 Tax=Jutongia hominis TaxID=2763664 RepID=A0ABR7MTC4_9FIRM|nr:helix-turn-helix transcriptional regulator [Jutongia hominis]MBC8556477.1 helix-turn-helix transcriptional regulator [Jutongia hominis]
MAFGKRIKFFRNRKDMKQKELGELLGFLGKTSDVRVAQYETEARTPKADLVKEMAQIFGVSPRAINVPNIDSYLGLMHTLFALEDMYGIKIGEIDGELCLRLDREHREYQHLFEPFHTWQQIAAKLESGEISQEEYDNWRYNYPELDTSEIRAKVPSLELSDELIKALKKENQ